MYLFHVSWCDFNEKIVVYLLFGKLINHKSVFTNSKCKCRSSKIFDDFVFKETVDDKSGKVHFIKCHCPFEVLRYYAEELSFKAPLEVSYFVNEIVVLF